MRRYGHYILDIAQSFRPGDVGEVFKGFVEGIPGIPHSVEGKYDVIGLKLPGGSKGAVAVEFYGFVQYKGVFHLIPGEPGELPDSGDDFSGFVVPADQPFVNRLGQRGGNGGILIALRIHIREGVLRAVDNPFVLRGRGAMHKSVKQDQESNEEQKSHGQGYQLPVLVGKRGPDPFRNA